MKKRGPSHDIVVVDLKEREWVKVLEVPVPHDLIWLGGIKMLHPVQFDRNELGLLVFYIREHARTVKTSREKRLYERLSDKMAEAMSSPPLNTRTSCSRSQFVPNDKQVVFKEMGKDLLEWEKSLGGKTHNRR